MIPNPNHGEFKQLIRRIEALERANPLSNSSLGRGQMRFYNGSVLLIQNGALRVTGSATISGLLDVTGRAEISGLLDVTGTAEISGILNVSGQTTLSGTTTIAGPTGITGALTIQGVTDVTGELNVTGPTTLDGETTISGNTTVTGDLAVDGPLDVTGDTTLGGTTEITGITTLKSDLVIEAGGKLTADQTEIRPDGSAKFGDTTIDAFGNMDIKGGSKVAGNFFVDDNATVTGELNVVGGMIFGLTNPNPGDAFAVGYSPLLKKLVAL